MNAKRILVIGWDGATFDIIDPMIAAGRLPNLAKVITRGARGRLASTVPPVTPVAWTTFATGADPGRHGIFDALILDAARHDVRFVSAARRRAAPIWTILSERGRRAGVVNVPVTYPPDPINGFLISGMFTPSDASDFVHPPELRQLVEAKFGPYRESPKLDPDPERYLDNLLAGVDRRVELTAWLMDREPADFFCSVFMESDRVQHFFWGYRDPKHPLHERLGRAIEAVYERLDAGLGRLMKCLPRDTAVCLVSDHGAGPLTRSIFLNRWLMDHGYLTLRADLAAGLAPPPRKTLARRLLGAAARRVLPEAALRRRRRRLSLEHDRVNNLFCSLVDWERSEAVSEGIAGGIFFNPALVSGERRAGLVAELKAGLTAIVDPDTGEKPFAAVFAREELYHGPAVADAPDVVTLCGPGYQVLVPHEVLLYGRDAPTGLFADHKWSGRHEQHGIFVLRGPGVAPGTRLSDCQMADVAPTLLYALDETVPGGPGGMDGRVLTGAFLPEELASRPPRIEAGGMVAAGGPVGEGTEGEAAKRVAEELSDLGYM